MSKKQKYILMITGGVFLLIILIVFLLTREKSPELVNENTNIPNKNTEDLNSEQSQNNNQSDFDSIKFEEENYASEKFIIKSVSKNFIERYATWSVDNKFEGLDAIRNITTDNMFRAIYNERQAYQDDSKFYGITSRVLDFKILELEEARVGVALVIQQEENKNNNIQINYQNLELELVKVNDEWLVNFISWK